MDILILIITSLIVIIFAAKSFVLAYEHIALNGKKRFHATIILMLYLPIMLVATATTTMIKSIVCIWLAAGIYFVSLHFFKDIPLNPDVDEENSEKQDTGVN